MKKNNNIALQLLAKLAARTAGREVNSTCISMSYQPEEPKCLLKLKKR